jgi:hypothetical protein
VQVVLAPGGLAVGDDVELDAGQGLDAGLAGSLVELDRAGGGAVVGEPDRWVVQLGCAVDDLADLGECVVDAELGMRVQ